MIQPVHKTGAEVYHLSGRDVYYLVGPKNSAARNVTVGVCVWQPGPAPEGHMHSTQEETIYIISGRGRFNSADGSVDLEPGTAVFIPPGLHHGIVCDGPDPLEFVTIFSPPVVFGEY